MSERGNQRQNRDKPNRGQQKQHAIFDASGQPVLDADGNQVTMTQAEWRERDKSLGYTRDGGEDDTDDDVTPEAPV
jgi:hypothetical protein